jgi:hypothetical protein
MVHYLYICKKSEVEKRKDKLKEKRIETAETAVR